MWVIFALVSSPTVYIALDCSNGPYKKEQMSKMETVSTKWQNGGLTQFTQRTTQLDS